MAVAKITKTMVERPKVPKSGHLVTWDSSPAMGGFGIRVSSTGRVSFVVRFWTGTRERWKTLGAHPRLSLTEARKQARKILRAAADGVDPVELEFEVKAAKRTAEAQTVQALAAEWLEVLPNKTTRRGRRISPRTVEQYESCMRLYIVPKLGKRPVSEVTRRDVAALHATATRKGGPYMGNRVASIVSIFYNWLAETEAVPQNFNPARRPPLNPEKRRGEHASVRLSHDQEARLVRSIFKLIADSDLIGGVALLTLLDTGRRVQEVLGLEWRRLDLEAGTADLGATKGMGAGDVAYFPTRVCEAIKQLPRIVGSKFVFSGHGKNGRRAGLQSAWESVKADAGLEEISPDLEGFHLHDLRHHRISEMLAAGVAPQLVARQVGHTSLDQLRVYSHLEVADVAKVLSRLESVGPAEDSEVIELKG